VTKLPVHDVERFETGLVRAIKDDQAGADTGRHRP
jgi:hypothetical protein